MRASARTLGKPWSRSIEMSRCVALKTEICVTLKTATDGGADQMQPKAASSVPPSSSLDEALEPTRTCDHCDVAPGLLPPDLCVFTSFERCLCLAHLHLAVFLLSAVRGCGARLPGEALGEEQRGAEAAGYRAFCPQRNQLRGPEKYASLGPSPPQEEDRREEMEAALQRLQEESNRCRTNCATPRCLVRWMLVFYRFTESRMRCRASAQLGLESLQKTELRQDSFAPLPRYPEGSMPMPATAQLAASTAASLALVEELNHGDLKEIPTQIPLQEAPHVRFGVLEDFHRRWPEDAVIQEEEEDELMELPRGLGSAAVVDVC
eukprot:g23468.t1